MSRHVVRRELLRILLPPLLLAGCFTLIAYAATGATTGFFFAGVVVATLLTPPLVLAESTRLNRLLCGAAIIDGVALAWLLAVTDPSITLLDWFRGVLVLTAFTLALCGLTALLRRWWLRGAAAAALVMTIAIAWLSWPVWLSPRLAGRERLVGLLTTPHPLLALDTVFRAAGPPWSERYFMYNLLTVLNQDVAYELPRSVLPAALLHGTIGATALLLGRRRSGNPQVDVSEGRGQRAGGRAAQ